MYRMYSPGPGVKVMVNKMESADSTTNTGSGTYTYTCRSGTYSGSGTLIGSCTGYSTGTARTSTTLRHPRVDDASSISSEDSGSYTMDDNTLTDMTGDVGTVHLCGPSVSDKLRVAASKGQLDKVQELVNAGAIFEPDREGRTALHYSALNGYTDVCKFLLSQGCDIDTQDALGFTALHRAVAQGHPQVVHILIDDGCNVNCQDDMHGNAPIHEASWNGFSQTLQMLVKGNCNVFVVNKAGFTALHLAAQNGHNESSRVLLYAGINSDMKNNYGDTALHTAARYGHAGVTRILLSARCSVNEQNKNGDTALHIVCALRRRKLAKLLTESTIDLAIKNKQHETALEVAKRKNHPEMVVIITSHQSKARYRQEKKPKEWPQEMDGPEVVPHDDKEPPTHPQPKKEKKYFFFRKKKTKEKEKPQPVLYPAQQKGRMGPPQGYPNKKSVQGLFSQYVSKPGYQYYRDLAGNVKQGPVGFAPTCQCGPILKKMEHRMDTDKDNVYEHIDASHQILRERIDLLDKRTTQQVYAIDKLTKERLDAEQKSCRERITHHMEKERTENVRRLDTHGDTMRTDLRGWVESRLVELGKEKQRPQLMHHPHDDSGLYFRGIFTGVDQNEGGRLFRTRSDETLSQSDYSMKNKKRNFYESRQAAMQSIRAWQVPSYQRDTNRPRVRGRAAEATERERGRSYHDIQGLTIHEERERSKSSQNLPSGQQAQPSDHHQQQQYPSAQHLPGPRDDGARLTTHLVQADIRQYDRIADGASPKFEGSPTGVYPNKGAITPTSVYPAQVPMGRVIPSQSQGSGHYSQGAIPKQSGGPPHPDISPKPSERQSVFSRLEPSPVTYLPPGNRENADSRPLNPAASPSNPQDHGTSHSGNQPNLAIRGPSGSHGQSTQPIAVQCPPRPSVSSNSDSYGRSYSSDPRQTYMNGQQYNSRESFPDRSPSSGSHGADNSSSPYSGSSDRIYPSHGIGRARSPDISPMGRGRSMGRFDELGMSAYSSNLSRQQAVHTNNVSNTSRGPPLPYSRNPAHRDNPPHTSEYNSVSAHYMDMTPTSNSRQDHVYSSSSRVWARPQGSGLKTVIEHPNPEWRTNTGTSNVPPYKQAPPYHSSRTLYDKPNPEPSNSAQPFSVMAALSKSEPFLAKAKQNQQPELVHGQGDQMTSAQTDTEAPCRDAPVNMFASHNGNVKDDSGSNRSNPDSGYSSRIYTNRLNTSTSIHGLSPRTLTSPSEPNNSAGTPSSSFSTDHNISTPTSTPSQSNSPFTHASTTPEYEPLPAMDNRQQQVNRNIVSHIQNWYQRKVHNTGRSDSPKIENTSPQSQKYGNNNSQPYNIQTKIDPHTNLRGSDV